MSHDRRLTCPHPSKRALGPQRGINRHTLTSVPEYVTPPKPAAPPLLLARSPQALQCSAAGRAAQPESLRGFTTRSIGEEENAC